MGRLNFKLLKRLLLPLLAVMIPKLVSAYDFKVDGLCYNLSNGAQVTYENCYYNDNYELIFVPSVLPSSVVIPTTVTYNQNTYSVRSIDHNTFNDCTGITSVTIPNSIEYIYDEAFIGCHNLTKVVISDLSSWCMIGFDSHYSNPLFYANHLFLNNTEIKDLVIPNSITKIGALSFCGCSGLTSVTIPNSVTSIGYNAFYGCSGLTSVNIPNSVTFLSGFSDCTGLTSVTIPNSVKSIGSGAFQRCTSLTSVAIPNSVTIIGDNAFFSCYGLQRVTIGKSITSIGDGAFWSCSGMKDIFCFIKNPESVTFKSDEDGDYYNFEGINKSTCVLHVPYGTANRYRYANHWSEFTNIVEMEEAFEPIEFADAAVEQICLANWDTNNDGFFTEAEAAAVSDIGTVFKSNTTIVSFNELQYFTGLTTIPANAFYYCTNLKRIHIPDNVTNISYSAFMGCSKLTDLILGNSVQSITSAMYGCKSLASITIPKSVTYIDGYNFNECDNLVSIIVEDGNPVYDSRDNCNAIIETATNTLIAGCNNTTIPNTVIRIGEGAFQLRWGLTEISFPESISQIDYAAFNGCFHLTDVYSYVVDPNNIVLGDAVFSDIVEYNSHSTTLHVPYGSGDLYRVANQWKVFNIVEMAPPTILATSVALNQTEAEMTEGETLTLTATVLPDDATDKTVTWASSDENVATVVDGVVTAVAEGTATITATTADGSNLSASCALTVNRLIIPGDANGDNSIDATDYVATANYILGDIPEGFDISAVDLDNNGVIDVADLVGVTNMILNANATQPAPQYAGAIGLRDFDINNRLYVENIAHSGVNTYTVSIALDNQDAFTALQADIYLPEDVALSSNFILSDRKAKDHSITSQVQPDGAIRIFISSPSSKNLRGSSGAIITFEVYGILDTSFEIKNIIASNDQAVGFHLQDFNLNNVVTGIDLYNRNKNAYDTYYNILGVPVENPTPGIYIKKGQKVIVK